MNITFTPQLESNTERPSTGIFAKANAPLTGSSPKIEAAIDEIRRHPQQFARWDETYRFYLLDKFPYFLAYRETADAIVIVTIRHSSQDQEAWQGR